MERSMTRREALAAGGAVVAAATLAPYLRLSSAAAQTSGAFTLPLRRIPELTKGRLNIPIVARDVPIVRGERTLMWTFDGTFPGPTIRRPAGATTRVTFRHRVPQAGTLTIHNHGHHTEAVHDGQPMSELIAPGAKREYVYRHVEEGEPLRGGMRWYHDHSHGRTNRNAWMGLLGLFIIDDPLEKRLKLPKGHWELPMVITSRTLDDNNQLVDPFTAAPDPGADAVGTGELLLVNGVPRPYMYVDPTVYRLRILNAASFNPYNLGFAPDGPKIVQIGNESGLFPAPAPRERVLMGPAERCDLLVDFSGFAGKHVVFSSAPQDSTSPFKSVLAPASAPAEDVIQFRVRAKRRKVTPAPRKAPAKLRALPKWATGLSTSPDRTFSFGQANQGGQTVWTINGEPYDHERVVARPELGSTETWMLVNSSQQSHYIHLHAVDWKVISRNGGTPLPDEDVLKETFRIDPGETIAVGAKFTDHAGRFLIHCHMLSHEDHAMMTTFEIVPPGSGDRTARISSASAPAVVRGERVRVPLDTFTPAERARTAAMLAEQARTPGRPATPPSEPLTLSPGAGAYLCRLPTQTRTAP
jgi:FtsP/CotA-like multicopper oxidase with cupredoxin domain